jgi:hypothetical protein
MIIKAYAMTALFSLVSGAALAGGRIEGPMNLEPLAGSVAIGTLTPDAPPAVTPGPSPHVVCDEDELDVYPAYRTGST